MIVNQTKHEWSGGKFITAAMAAVLLSFSITHAEHVNSNWTGTDDYWSQDGVWDTDHYPRNGYPDSETTWWARISGDVNVTLDTDVDLSRLNLGVGSGQPTITGPHQLNIEDTFIWNRGTLTGGVTVNALSGIDFFHAVPADHRYLENAVLNHSGMTEFMPGDDFYWTTTSQSASASAQNHGSPIYAGQAALFMADATFNNTDQGAMVFDSWSFIGEGDNAVFNNSGALHFENTGFFSDVQLNNAGTISANGGLTTSGRFNNSGTVNLQGGQMNISAGGESSGTMHINSGGLRVSNFTFTEESHLLVDNWAHVDFQPGVTTIAGTYDIRHAEIQGWWAPLNRPEAEVVFDGDGILRSVYFDNGVISGSGTLTTHWVPWLGGTMAGTGTTLNKGDIVMSPPGWEGSDPLFLHRTIRNEGEIGFMRFDWLGAVGDVQMKDGRIDNHDMFRARFSEGDSRFYSAGGENVIHNHQGATFLVDIGWDSDAVSVLTIEDGIDFINDGRLRVEQGILRVQGGYQHGPTGSLTLGTLTSQGGLEADTIEITGGTLGGRGTITGDVYIHDHTVKTSPGSSAGELTIDGNLLKNAGILEIELGGTIFDDHLKQYDRLAVTGTATLGADVVIQVLLIDQFSQDYHPEMGDIFDILTAESIDLDEAIVMDFPALSDGLYFTYELLELNPSQALRLTVVPEPATAVLLTLGLLAVRKRKAA